MFEKINKPENLDQNLPAYYGYDVYNGLLEQSKNAGEINKNLLLRIVKDNADTEYGKKYGFDTIETIEDFKEKVPFSEYDDYAEAIEHMLEGEKGLITNYPIVYYAKTSGSMDNPKSIPISEETLDIYSKKVGLVSQAVYDYFVRDIKGRAPNRGKQFTTSVISVDEVADKTRTGPISAAIYTDMKDQIKATLPWPVQVMYPEGRSADFRYLRAFYGLKDKDIVSLISPFVTAIVDNLHYIQLNWESLCDDIEKGELSATAQIDPELREELQAMLEPDPERAQELREIFKEGFDEPFVPKVWPKVDYVSSTIGGTFAQYADKIRQYIGDIPIYSNAYSASEASLAVAMDMNNPVYLFLPDTGYFEFLPTDSDSEETLNIDELEVGKDYEVIVTNLSGLYRYRLGDVIEVVDYQNELPVVKFKYRKKQMVNIAGEKSNESHLTWMINELEKETGAQISDYSIYADTDTLPGRYVLFLESVDQVDKEERSGFRDIADNKLGERNPSYGSKVKDELLLPMELLFVQPETYYLYRDMMILRGTSENQIKPVRVIDTPRKERFFFNLIDEE